ncbi:MAG TPA: hypothetical protein VFB60_06375 [Ktedonobacteraceae bacterium]|nr:hypothetical protein [Ktedonobacteraceae bacterium]
MPALPPKSALPLKKDRMPSVPTRLIASASAPSSKSIPGQAQGIAPTVSGPTWQVLFGFVLGSDAMWEVGRGNGWGLALVLVGERQTIYQTQLFPFSRTL